MPIPITSLDDRKFDDLVSEAKDRLRHHIPEMTNLSEGDPLYALVDLFAWMTESVIYRANLIPERQRQAFLNLLQLPLRPARPAKALVSIDVRPDRKKELPPLLHSESRLKAGEVNFTTQGELQPMPFSMALMTKERLEKKTLEELDISAESLRTLYNTEVKAFRPRSIIPSVDPITLSNTLDKSFYLLVYLPDVKQLPQKNALRESIAGSILNIGLAPLRNKPADMAEEVAPGKLKWDIAWQKKDTDKQATYLPLELVADSSNGGRQMGVARLRLPKSQNILNSNFATDPQYAGFDNTPPEIPADILPEQVMFWLRLQAPEDNNFELSYIGMNAVDGIGQGIVRDEIISIGDGRPEQAYQLSQTNIDAGTLQIDVSEHGVFVPWQQVPHFSASTANDKVYRFDSANGVIQFGDGLRGKRPQPNSRIRAAYYRYGGGVEGNLPAGSIKQLVDGSSRLVVRHELASMGGLDAESYTQAEQRIPAHLSHRDRAVTKEDFAVLARDNPINPVGRAELISGLLPGSSLNTVRENIPGVLSLFVLPPGLPELGGAPRPTAGLLRDVYQYLDTRKLLGTELYVLSPEFIPLAISVGVQVLDATRITEILNQINQAILKYLWVLTPGGPANEGWPMGRDIEINELKAVVARVSGVLSVGELRLFHQNTDDNNWLEAHHLRLQSYQLPEVIDVTAQQAEPGEHPSPPDIVNPDTGTNSGTGTGNNTAIAVPVIPDLC